VAIAAVVAAVAERCSKSAETVPLVVAAKRSNFEEKPMEMQINPIGAGDTEPN
jgi:hypothetical protein